jgi:hypothetical protein
MARKLWNKDFILLLQGNTVSTIGDLMYSVAIGYWVYVQTGSTALMTSQKYEEVKQLYE